MKVGDWIMDNGNGDVLIITEEKNTSFVIDEQYREGSTPFEMNKGMVKRYYRPMTKEEVVKMVLKHG